MKITIIGAAGTLGSCTAFALVLKKLADEILMIDPFESALKGHWLDLTAVGASRDVLITRGSYEDMVNTEIVVMAAGAPQGAMKSRSELLPRSLPIVKEAVENINRYCPEAIIIMATNPVDPLNYAAYLMSPEKDRRKYIGYSLNDTLRFRMWAAEALGVSASRMGGTVIGEHGNNQVMLFSTLRLDSRPVELDPETRNKIREQPSNLLQAFESLSPRRTSGWSSAYGTAIVIDAVRNNTRTMLPCSTILQGEYGFYKTSLTVPVVLGKRGIEEVPVLELTTEEKDELESAVQAIRPQMLTVEEFLR